TEHPMKFISFTRNSQPGFGALAGDQVIDLGSRLGVTELGQALREHGLDALRNKAARQSGDFPVSQISGYRPVVADPRKIFCVGLNYDAHVEETKLDRTEKPTIFARFAASQVGHLQPMLVP